MKTLKKIVTVMSVGILFGGCASKVESVYGAKEKLLSTGSHLQSSHAIVYYPEDIRLHFPGYIVGIEKSLKDYIDINRSIKYANLEGVSKQFNNVENEPKLHYISHIFKYDNGFDRALYNLYASQVSDVSNAYSQSWDALELLKKDILKKEDDYNVIVVVVMGWNTVQEEAIRNFNSIYRTIKKASNNSFKPLFIGVTWPSEWESSFIPDFMIKMVSFPIKANDADEIGLTWLGVLLHDTLKLDNSKPVIVIGHSFGARATSMATFKGNIIYKDYPIKKNKIDTLVSIQGAYPIKRYAKKGYKGVSYDINSTDTNVVLTSSKYDEALDLGFWNTPWKANYVGDDKSFNIYKDGKGDKSLFVECIDYNQTTDIAKYFSSDNKILYLNCDAIINTNAYKSGGGAHSDIYDAEMGKLLWKVIKATEDNKVK